MLTFLKCMRGLEQLKQAIRDKKQFTVKHSLHRVATLEEKNFLISVLDEMGVPTDLKEKPEYDPMFWISPLAYNRGTYECVGTFLCPGEADDDDLRFLFNTAEFVEPVRRRIET